MGVFGVKGREMSIDRGKVFVCSSGLRSRYSRSAKEIGRPLGTESQVAFGVSSYLVVLAERLRGRVVLWRGWRELEVLGLGRGRRVLLNTWKWERSADWGLGKIPGIGLGSCVKVANGLSRQKCCGWVPG
jgi:hypothetical protein